MRIGTRVEVTNDPDIVAGHPEGVLIGFGHFLKDGYYDLEGEWHGPDMSECLLVRLDQGFYSPGEESYVEVLTVHPDNVKCLVAA